jgi:hypothetical protein
MTHPSRHRAAQVPAESDRDGAREEDGTEVIEIGGLRFDVSFRGPGATLRVLGPVDGEWTELLRFDDFVEQPHFHAPAAGPSIPFDRSLGEPLDWYVSQIRDHLAEWLGRSGFESVVPSLDLSQISERVDEVTQAMIACVPDGYERVTGRGLQRVEATA